MRSAYVRHLPDPRLVVEEHLASAENAVKDPTELASVIDAIYHATMPGGWILVEAPTAVMLAVLDVVGHTRKPTAPIDNERIGRFREKLLRMKPLPGVLGYEAGADRIHVLDGAHRLVACQLAGRPRSPWYVPAAGRGTLDTLIETVADEMETAEAASASPPAMPVALEPTPAVESTQSQ